jgi:subtilisin family serine protease
VRGPEQQLDEHREATTRVQVRLIEEAFGTIGGLAMSREKDGDEAYLCHPTRLLTRGADNVGRLDTFFEDRKDVYEGRGRIVEEVVDDLVAYELPSRRDERVVDLERLLEEVDRDNAGVDVARPDHIVYLTPRGYGQLCPATEPELPLGKGPVPPPTGNREAGRGVRVSVVDSGWYAAAEANPETPWLAGNIEGDLETVDQEAIHPYAGHGTFVAGVIRCLAPATYIEIEGVLTKAGAVFESEITKELNEAMTDKDRPQLISISAGCRTRRDLGLIGFEALAQKYELTKGDGAVLVVAAAGNDATKRPFYPAAYPWVLSVGALDEDMTVSDFSNYGDWVDVYAHGRDLVNAFPTGTYTCHEPAHAGEVRSFTGMAQWSGTSFATPVVTGLIAAHMSEHGVGARAAVDALVAAGKQVTDPGGLTRPAVGPPFV